MISIRCVAALLAVKTANAADQPFWGCGMLGDMGGIQIDGTVSPAMQTVIDGLKATNKQEGKVHYWNWNFAPENGDKCTNQSHQYLTKDFVFMPENWGVGVPNDTYVRPAGTVGWIDSSGVKSPALMSNVFLGANEPDIIGSCMGDMMGKCLGPSTPGEAAPVAHLCGAKGTGSPNPKGHCDCWSDSHATGVGFWPVQGVGGYQPLPTCWNNPQCVDSIMGSWKQTASIAVAKGYKYLSAPLVAVNLNWTKSFLEHACNGCSDISCGCPNLIGWHFYANDCEPEKGGYADFQHKLDATVELMEQFPHLQGAVVNEVGMLNCAMDTPDAICVPNGPNQKYPALKQPNHACPVTPSLPKGLGSFIEELLSMASKSKTKDDRRAVVLFTWFNEDMSGGTYNLRIFDDDGSLNEVGKSYISACQAWASGTQEQRIVV